MKIHLGKFSGYDYCMGILGEAHEVYEPLCGALQEDPHVTEREERVTCRRCLKIAGLKPYRAHPPAAPAVPAESSAAEPHHGNRPPA